MKLKQTAIQWLSNQLSINDRAKYNLFFEQAEEIEKDQIIEAFEDGFWEGCEEKLSDNTGQVYYNYFYGTPQ
jgi:hypothetical protein